MLSSHFTGAGSYPSSLPQLTDLGGPAVTNGWNYPLVCKTLSHLHCPVTSHHQDKTRQWPPGLDGVISYRPLIHGFQQPTAACCLSPGLTVFQPLQASCGEFRCFSDTNQKSISNRIVHPNNVDMKFRSLSN